MIDYGKKGYKIAIFALVMAFLAYSIGGSVVTNESIFQIEVNNTNLAPSVAGESIGTGERIQGTTYYANNTPIQLFVFAHANTPGQDAETHLFINGTKVVDTSGKPLGTAEQQNRSIVALIPRAAYYMIETTNVHHYEWREYRILSGQNGSVNVTTNVTTINNYTNITNVSQIDNASLNLKVNKSGDTMSGALSVNEAPNTFINFGNSSISGASGTHYQTNTGDIEWVLGGSASGYNREVYIYDRNTGSQVYSLSLDTFQTSLFGGIRMNRSATINASFAHDGNWISFGHPGLSEDFIGYRDNAFWFKDSPGGGDVTDPAIVAGNFSASGQSGTGTRAACFQSDGALVASTNATFGYSTC